MTQLIPTAKSISPVLDSERISIHKMSRISTSSALNLYWSSFNGTVDVTGGVKRQNAELIYIPLGPCDYAASPGEPSTINDFVRHSSVFWTTLATVEWLRRELLQVYGEVGYNEISLCVFEGDPQRCFEAFKSVIGHPGLASPHTYYQEAIFAHPKLHTSTIHM
jgi:hypothetical protein